MGCSLDLSYLAQCYDNALLFGDGTPHAGQVAVRCRPFSIDDRLGVQMVQNGDEEGEVNLLNSDYTTNRFAFTYSWWSAYGYDRHVESNQARLTSAA